MAARKEGLSEKHIYHCNNHQEIVELLAKELGDGDLVLVKGSQGTRMEKVVLGILADASQASEVLVRQSGEWKDK